MPSPTSSGDLGFESNADGSMVFSEDMEQGSFHVKVQGDRQVKDYLKLPEDDASSLLKTFCRHTTAHGFRCAASRERSRTFRCLWTLATLVASAALSGALLELWCNYHCYPVKTVVDLKYLSQLPFPAVTLCNLQSFNCRWVVGNIQGQFSIMMIIMVILILKIYASMT
ncbi:unnamed protein product [Candidula unifasciata]|uniref:Uncharacterized protein n=1 Tax=Candidula unifasciata TaxID=100452 RepID=A0A8S3YYW5_9EUPU|nr:unnamed protein product [Candidula unifasciata]